MGYEGLRLEVNNVSGFYVSTYAEPFAMFTSSMTNCRDAIEASLELARQEFGFLGAPKAWLGNDKLKLSTDSAQTDKEVRQVLQELELIIA